MEFILVFLMFVLTVFVIRRTGALSPASIVCNFSSLSIAVFCYVVYGGGRDALSGGAALSFAIGDYHQEAPLVIGIYFLVVALTAAAVFGLKQPVAGTGNDTGNFVLALMDRFLFSTTMPLIAAGLLGVSALSLLLEAVGAWNSPLVQVVNMGIGPVTVIYMSLLIYSWGRQSKLVIGMFMLLLLYNYAFCLAFYSRFTALTWVVATALIALRRISAGKKVLSWSVATSALLSGWTFLYAIQGRGDRMGIGLDVFNWPVMIRNFFGITLDSSTFASVATNIFQGPMVLAECIGTGSTVSYDPRYMYLSFSPLPAFLDGWRSVIDTQHFVNFYTPFSAFGEVYFFGWPYIILFSIIMVVCIRLLTRIYMQIGGTGGLLLTSPCVYSLLCLHQYALRNSMRYLYFTTFFVCFLSVYLTRKAKESGLGRELLASAKKGLARPSAGRPGVPVGRTRVIAARRFPVNKPQS